MFYYISLYISLAIFLIGLIYKVSTWFSLKTTVDSKTITTAKRASSALEGIIFTIFSVKILTLIKVSFLDIVLQRKVLREDPFRWSAHILLYGGFMLLLLMHALDEFITSSLFANYSATINPFIFLRDLFGALVIIGICMAIYRRFILKAPRLKTNTMDIFAITLIAIIMVSGILLEGAKIGSYSIYKQMVTDYAGLEEEEEDFKALTAFWVKDFGTLAPDLKAPFDTELLEAGKEIHEMIDNKKDLLERILGRKNGPDWKEVNVVLQQVMSDYAGALRTEALLDTGCFHLQRIKEKALDTMAAGNQHELGRSLEVLNMIDICELVFLTAKERKETRGLHIRPDYPLTNPRLNNKIQVIKSVDHKPVTQWRPTPK